jgi:hypothetical protein
LVWSYSDHGVTLTDDAIAWSLDGQQAQASFNDIAEVHLQLSYIEENAVASCRLRFVDGTSLAITSSNSRGFQDAALDRVYVEFIHDLHARLAARGDLRTAAFTAGFSEARHQLGIVFLVIAGLILVVLPVVMLLFTWEWKVMLIIYSCAVFLWPLYKSLQANTPRTYDPQHVPQELMPARLNLPPQINPLLLDSID